MVIETFLDFWCFTLIVATCFLGCIEFAKIAIEAALYIGDKINKRLSK